MWCRLLIIFLSVYVSGFASATSLQDARNALWASDYDSAYAQASVLNNEAGWLLGAEILNTKIMLGQSRAAKKDAKLAMALSQQVLDAQPDNAEAKMLYAFAYGFYARTVSIITVWRKKIPQKTMAAITEARTSNPDDPRGDALLGGWHLSVVYKAGASRAKRSFNADEQYGYDLFDKAVLSAPQDVFIAGNYIMMLTAIGGDANAQKAQLLLQGLEGARFATAPELHMLSVLVDLNAEFEQPDQAQKMAVKFLSW